MKEVLLATYSHTGNSRLLAGIAETELRRMGTASRSVSFRPQRDLPYALWLALSFVPRLAVPVECPDPDPRSADACLLCFPKWTLSCPPVNGFLRNWGRDLPPTALLVSCGGWDQARYLQDYADFASKLGVPILGGVWVRRRAATTERVRRALQSFLVHCLA